MANKNDDSELNGILEVSANGVATSKRRPRSVSLHEPPDDPGSPGSDRLNGLTQWTTGDNKRFFPASTTCPKLTPACYEIQHGSNGIYFEKIPVNIDGLVRFPQANTDRVLTEIQNFWTRDALFREYNQTHKRGILMWGPPGSGKSCTVKFIMKDVIEERGGIVIKFSHPKLFADGMRIFREIEPHTPAVVLMEDIDSIIESYSESDVLNILDGVDKIERIVFLGSTNYPEVLGSRIVNRPSRFDKRFKIGHPNSESRRIYLKHVLCDPKKAEAEGLKTPWSVEKYIASQCKKLKIDLDCWVKDTGGFSIAHLKELFIAVVILGDGYDQAIKTLRSMKDVIKSDSDSQQMGFVKTAYNEDDAEV